MGRVAISLIDNCISTYPWLLVGFIVDCGEGWGGRRVVSVVSQNSQGRRTKRAEREVNSAPKKIRVLIHSWINLLQGFLSSLLMGGGPDTSWRFTTYFCCGRPGMDSFDGMESDTFSCPLGVVPNAGEKQVVKRDEKNSYAGSRVNVGS